MAKINCSDIAEELAARMGLSKTAAKDYTDYIFEAIKEHVENGDEVSIKMFGKFKTSVTAQRKGRDINTRKIIVIPPKTKLVFEMSRQLAQNYNNKVDGDDIIDLGALDDLNDRDKDGDGG